MSSMAARGHFMCACDEASEHNHCLFWSIAGVSKKHRSPISRSPPKKGGKSAHQQELERDLEEGLEETFPGSDPVAITDPVVDLPKGRQKTRRRRS